MLARFRGLHGGWLVAVAITSIALAACGPSSYDLYIQAMQAQEKASRGACKLVWDNSAGAHVLNSGKITSCLSDLKEAQALYHRAQAAGTQGTDFATAIENVDAEVAKVEAMLRMVSKMEQDAQLDRIEKQVN